MLPRISKDGSGNATWIVLSAAPQEKIDWDESIEHAQSALARGQKIFWELDLGFSAPLSFDDELLFQSRVAALRHFSSAVFPRFETHSLGATLYRGPLDLGSRFLWSSSQEKSYALWTKENPNALETQFCLDTCAAYMQMLAHKLPDELPIFLLFDATGLTRTQALHLLSKERFEHFELGARGVNCLSWCHGWEERSPYGWIGEKNAPASFPEPLVGLLMPQEYTPQFEELLQRMDASDIVYRVVQEELLTQQWDGLDAIVVGDVSSRGKRMLRGFCAAGGTVVAMKNSLELPEEIGWDEFRGRGIRTPDLLVPNQPR